MIKLMFLKSKGITWKSLYDNFRYFSEAGH